MPITFNVYAPGASGQTGTKIATQTHTFNIPFRPTSTPAQCSGDVTEWYSAVSGACQHGLATNVSFDFSSLNANLPSTIIYGISYNTSTNEYSPLGASSNRPVDSLNVALTTEPSNVSVGSDAHSGKIFLAQSAATGSSQIANCGGTLTAGLFQEYTVGCANGLGSVNNIPAVQINVAGGGGSPGLYPGGSTQNIEYAISNPGPNPAQIQSATVKVADNGTDIYNAAPATGLVVGCHTIWYQINHPILTLNVTVPAGGTTILNTAAQLSITGQTTSIQMLDSGTNQNVCESQPVGLIFTAN